MHRKGIAYFFVAAVLLLATTFTAGASDATANICPICGGGWDDYWALVGRIVDINVAVFRGIVGI